MEVKRASTTDLDQSTDEEERIAVTGKCPWGRVYIAICISDGLLEALRAA